MSKRMDGAARGEWISEASTAVKFQGFKVVRLLGVGGGKNKGRRQRTANTKGICGVQKEQQRICRDGETNPVHTISISN
jgi:hypothetical protein